MQTRHKIYTSPGGYAGILQVRGDLGLKLGLLFLTLHLLSTQITSNIKGTAAMPAQTAPAPALKLFIAPDGAIRLDPKGPAVSTAELQAAVSNVLVQANGRPPVVALCLPKTPMTEAVLKAGLAAGAATNIETALTITPDL